MKRKIKITEQQLNYIVENIVRKSKVNNKTSKAKYLKSLRQLNEETIDEEILDEGVKEWVAIALMLFPSLSKAGAVEATKALNQSPIGKEMIKQAKEDVDKGDTYSMDKEDIEPRYRILPKSDLNLMEKTLEALFTTTNGQITNEILTERTFDDKTGKDGWVRYFLLNPADFSMERIDSKLGGDKQMTNMANSIIKDLVDHGFLESNPGGTNIGGEQTTDWQLTDKKFQDYKYIIRTSKDRKERGR